IDREFPGAKEADYDTSSIFLDGAVDPNTDGFIRWAMSQAKITKADGDVMLRAAADAHTEISAFSTPEEFDRWAAQQYDLQVSLLGQGDPARLEQRLAVGQKLLAEMEASSPGLSAMLLNSGALDSARWVVPFIHHAERLAAGRAELDTRGGS